MQPAFCNTARRNPIRRWQWAGRPWEPSLAEHWKTTWPRKPPTNLNNLPTINLARNSNKTTLNQSVRQPGRAEHLHCCPILLRERARVVSIRTPLCNEVVTENLEAALPLRSLRSWLQRRHGGPGTLRQFGRKFADRRSADYWQNLAPKPNQTRTTGLVTQCRSNQKSAR
jgi:hypothetical protein